MRVRTNATDTSAAPARALQRRAAIAWIRVPLLGALIGAVCLLGGAAWAAGGASFDVVTTASTAGARVPGVVTVTNLDSAPMTVTSMAASLEVRFDAGVAIPALPAGSSAGWYRVAEISLPVPVTVAAASSQSFPFVIDPCSASLASYRSAKDMRALASVSAGRVRDGSSSAFPLPAPCPVCGNAVVETGEQCDAGPNGGGCCSAICRFSSDGTTCNDGNACTQVDACAAGSCVGANFVVCSATDQCRSVGTCDPATGACSQPPKPNGSACDDQNACTRVDTCQAGSCRGGSPVVCAAAGPCMSASCDPTTGACADAPKPDGTTCTDSNACTSGDRCAGGLCTSGASLVCNDSMSCTQDTCNPATGCSFTRAATCGACDASQCADCSGRCQTQHDDCAAGCWAGFMACLDGCSTQTYCAPFCQVDLGRCLGSCPTTEACRSACETGNGCGTGCSVGASAQSASPQVPSFSSWGFGCLAAFLALVGCSELVVRGRKRDERPDGAG